MTSLQCSLPERVLQGVLPDHVRLPCQISDRHRVIESVPCSSFIKPSTALELILVPLHNQRALVLMVSIIDCTRSVDIRADTLNLRLRYDIVLPVVLFDDELFNIGGVKHVSFIL